MKYRFPWFLHLSEYIHFPVSLLAKELLSIVSIYSSWCVKAQFSWFLYIQEYNFPWFLYFTKVQFPWFLYLHEYSFPGFFIYNSTVSLVSLFTRVLFPWFLYLQEYSFPGFFIYKSTIFLDFLIVWDCILPGFLICLRVQFSLVFIFIQNTCFRCFYTFKSTCSGIPSF